MVAHPNDPRSGDFGYSDDEMKKFGANEGFKVYKALETAADRNISIRYILCFCYANDWNTYIYIYIYTKQHKFLLEAAADLNIGIRYIYIVVLDMNQ